MSPIFLSFVKRLAFRLIECSYVCFKRAQKSLRQQLILLDATQDELTKLKPKIGLIPSTRDSRTLAISVLADVLSAAGKQNL